MTLSLHRRLLISAAVVLVLFLCLTGLSLDRAFQKNARTAVYERLKGELYAALGVAEMDKAGRLYLVKPLPNPHFHSVDSHLYAEFYHLTQPQRWQSLSLLDTEIRYQSSPTQGQYVFDQAHTADNKTVFVLSYGAAWRDQQNRLQEFVFRISEDKSIFEQQVVEFRYNLWGWLAGSTLFLLLVQAVVLRWGLAPLRNVAEEIKAIENENKENLSGTYPSELSTLTDNINTLITANRTQLNRYRHALDDLAHSLKTPLAVLQAHLESEDVSDEKHDDLVDQIRRMNDIIQYHLQRAATAGSRHWVKRVNVNNLLEKTIRAVKKVYLEKDLEFVIHSEDGVEINIDDSDLMEIMGNLVDNACKWARSRLVISIFEKKENETNRFCLVVEDDGPGFPQDQINNLRTRGARADQRIDGQGIGLALIDEIVAQYNGNLDISSSDMGGARVVLTLPVDEAKK